MNYSFEDYESAMKSLREELYAIKDEAAQDDFRQSMKDADEEYNRTSRDAYVNYRKSTDPYGVEFESITSSGLGSSGKERSILGENFSEYQSHLSDAFRKRQDITTELVRNLMKSQSENDSQRINDAINLAREKMEEYWREYSWNYRLERDKIEDERYEKELNAKYSK